MTRAALLLACVCAACGPAGGARDDAVAPADRVLRLAPGTTTYHLVSHQRIEQEFQGQLTTNVLASAGWITVTLTPARGDTLAARMVVDSMVHTGSAFAPGDLAAIRGATFTAQLAPNGQLTGFSGNDSAGLHNQVANALREFFPRLPEGGVRPGAAWADTVERAVNAGGLPLTIRTVSHHAATGHAAWGGEEALVIETRSDYTMQGEGSQAGQPLTLEGSGRRHLREYLGADGQFVGSVAADTATFDVLLTALGMTIPGRQASVDTVRALR